VAGAAPGGVLISVQAGLQPHGVPRPAALHPVGVSSEDIARDDALSMGQMPARDPGYGVELAAACSGTAPPSRRRGGLTDADIGATGTGRCPSLSLPGRAEARFYARVAARTEAEGTTGALESPLAAAVRAARAHLGLTQAELARRAGVTASYVSRIESAAWERGGPWPSDDVLRALSRVLGCSSTGLVRMKDHARERAAQSKPHRAGSPKYAIGIGDEDVLRAAQDLLERNPPRGSLRVSSQLFEDSGGSVSDASLADVLGRRLAEDTAAVLYRMCVVHRGGLEDVRATAHRLAVGRDPRSVRNIRLRCCFAPPALFDVVVGEHEALIAIPDRAGHPTCGPR